MKSVCPLCGARRAKRACPGVSRDICAVCCGTKRLTEIRCPVDCGYLAVSREHPPASTVKQHQLDVALLVRGVEETAAGLGADASAYRSLIGPLAAGWRAVEPLFLATPPFDLRPPLRALGELGAQVSLRALRAGLSTAVGLAERT